MSQYVLDGLLWVCGIRGDIPRHDDFGGDRGETPFTGNTGTLMRVLAAAVAAVAFLSLALWAAVWLAIKLL